VKTKLAAAIAASFIAAPLFAGTASAAVEVCVPVEASIEIVTPERTERVLVTPAVEALFEVKLHTWTGGPTETAPSWLCPAWTRCTGTS
jgi:hypothetical protein